MDPSVAYYLGLDLGQARDYTALTIIERYDVAVGEPEERYGESYQETEWHYRLRYVERFPLGTPYPAIVERVKTITDELATEHEGELVSCVVDKTGVGAPVVDMLSRAELRCSVTPITITGGQDVHSEHGEYSVPKRDLASTLQVLLQTGRLKFAARLPFREVLERELQNFKVKINVATGHDSYEAWREGDHDDLVLAVALACWYGVKRHGRHVVFTASTREVARVTSAYMGMGRPGGRLDLRGY